MKTIHILKINEFLLFTQNGKRYDLNFLPKGFEIKGDLDLRNLGLKKLPNLSHVNIAGDFDCSQNHLTTLEGAPRHVGRDFICSDNDLTSLKGAPEKIHGTFDCSRNQLSDLKGSPKKVKGDFICSMNRTCLTLKGMPEHIGGTCLCQECEFSLKKSLGKKSSFGYNVLSKAYTR